MEKYNKRTKSTGGSYHDVINDIYYLILLWQFLHTLPKKLGTIVPYMGRDDAFIQNRFYSETFLHTDAFTRKHFYTQTLSHRYTFIRTKTFAQRFFYTPTLLHTNLFTDRLFYTQTLLYIKIFTPALFQMAPPWGYGKMLFPEKETAERNCLYGYIRIWCSWKQLWCRCNKHSVN